MVYYVLVKVTINVLGLAEVIINIVVCHHKVLALIMTDWSLLFIFKFWFSLCYLLKIKQKLPIAFHPQTDDQTKRQNHIIDVYFRIFINWEQDNYTKLLLIAEFAYNNTKNASTCHNLFEFNCGYYPQVSFKEDIYPHSRSHSANKRAKELKKLIEVCYQNLFHTQKLQKNAHDKGIKSCSYGPDKNFD